MLLTSNSIMKKIFHVFVAMLFVLSCQPRVRFAFDDIEYITSFGSDERYLPTHTRSVIDLGIDGISSFKIYGPYLIVSSKDDKGQIKVLDKNAPYTLLGSFFPKGNGPGELIYPVPAGTFQYQTGEDGTVCAEFSDGTGKIIRFNITESVCEGRTVTEKVSDAGRLTFETVDLGEDGIFYKEMSPERDAQIRFIVRDGEKIVTRSMEKLNAPIIRNKVDDGTRFNVLSGQVFYNPRVKRFAETPGEINAVHMYSLDDSFAKTFCFGDKLYDFNEIADRDFANRPVTCVSSRAYDDFLVVLYLDGVTEREFQTDPSWRPSLLLILWDGSEVRKLNIPDRVDSFDVDFETLHIFAFDSDSETMYIYDASDV